MTVIAATAAAPSQSALPGAGGQGMDQGFDALLAIVNRSDERAPPKSAPAKVSRAAVDKAPDGAAERPAPSARTDVSAANADKADKADAASTRAARDAEDERPEEAVATAPPATEGAVPADAAALAAAALVAAMIPKTEETFAAAALPDAATTAPVVGASGPTPTDLALLQAAAAAEIEAGSFVAATGLNAAASALATEPTLDKNSVASAVVDPNLAGQAPASVAAATIEIPKSSLLDVPIAAEAAGVDVAALAAQAAPSQNRAPQNAPVAGPAETPVLAAEVEAPAVATAPIVETSRPLTEAVSITAPVVAEPGMNAAAVAVMDAPAGAPANADVEPVAIAGIETASPGDQASADHSESGQQGGQRDSAAEALSALAASDVAADPDAPTISQTTTAPVAGGAEVPTALRAETRGSPETVAQLSAEILKKLDARTTRFDVALTPEGLGKVDVRIEIGRHGALTASMAFDTAQAAAELRGKSHELRLALSQAGFTIADNALRFDVSSQGGQNGQSAFFNFNGGEDGRRAWSGKAFQSAQNDDAPTLSASDLLPGLRMTPDSGLDIRI